MPSTRVGVAVVDNTPKARNRSAEPTWRKFAGRVNCGAADTSVMVVEVLYAAPAPAVGLLRSELHAI